MCEILDKNGKIIKKLMEEIFPDYRNLKCVTNNKLHTIAIIFPYYSEDKKMISKLDNVIKEAKNKDVKYIETETKLEDDYKQIVVFKEDKYKTNAILYAYILDNFFTRDIQGEEFLNPIYFILYRLAGHSDTYIKTFYLRKYILASSLQKKLVILSDIDKNNSLDSFEKYDKKYELIKKYDNFTDFNKKYRIVEKESEEILNEIKNNPEFLKFSKNAKVKLLKNFK